MFHKMYFIAYAIPINHSLLCQRCHGSGQITCTNQNKNYAHSFQSRKRFFFLSTIRMCCHPYIYPNNDLTRVYRIERISWIRNLVWFGFRLIVHQCGYLLNTNMSHHNFAEVFVPITFIVVCIIYSIIFCSRKFKRSKRI